MLLYIVAVSNSKISRDIAAFDTDRHALDWAEAQRHNYLPGNSLTVMKQTGVQIALYHCDGEAV